MSGAINSVLDWRWTFRLLGIAGFCILPLAALALYEPKTTKQRRLERVKGKKTYSVWVRRTLFKQEAIFIYINYATLCT